MALDGTVAAGLLAHRPTGDLSKALHAAEHFGTPFGAGLILLTIGASMPNSRRQLLAAFAIAVGAGLVADILKLFVSRARPATFDLALPAWQSFMGSFSLGAGGAARQGFPSAHTAFAVAFAVALGTIFPSSRRWFLVLAALVALERITSLAHFPSDTLVGAAVGWVVGSLATHATIRKP